MHRIGSGRSFRTEQRGPSITRPFLIARFALLGLRNSTAMCALFCSGDLRSMGLIHRADLMDPAGREFLRSISLRVGGSSVLRCMGTSSTRVGKGLAVSVISEPNLAVKALDPSGERSQSAVSGEFTSYRTWPCAVFLAEMNSASVGTVRSDSRTRLRVMLAFRSRMSSFRLLNEAVGSLSGGDILIVLVCARHFSVAIVGGF